MGFQKRYGLPTPEAEVPSDGLAVSRQDDSVVFFNPGGVILEVAEDDKEQVRLAGRLLRPRPRLGR